MELIGMVVVGLVIWLLVTIAKASVSTTSDYYKDGGYVGYGEPPVDSREDWKTHWKGNR